MGKGRRITLRHLAGVKEAAAAAESAITRLRKPQDRKAELALQEEMPQVPAVGPALTAFGPPAKRKEFFLTNRAGFSMKLRDRIFEAGKRSWNIYETRALDSNWVTNKAGI